MHGDYRAALSYFKNAEALYKKIGDRVSYAYTLWSVGTTFKMTGHMDRAVKSFKEAAAFFRQTKDPRGMIYCILGKGEVDYLCGRKKKGTDAFLKALKMTDEHGFRLEKKYARRLLRYSLLDRGFPVNLP
jgi:tetratricopeptide (TPR) repeat protein